MISRPARCGKYYINNYHKQSKNRNNEIEDFNIQYRAKMDEIAEIRLFLQLIIQQFHATRKRT